MSVSPLGNVVYVNQNMHIASNLSSNLQNRFDLQNVAAMLKANEQKDEKAKIRPTEETHDIDPENEHEKYRIKDAIEQDEKNKKKSHSNSDEIEEEKEKVEESENIPSGNSSILDLKA